MHNDIQLPIPDRSTAGQWLSQEIHNQFVNRMPVVLALPRGGVPVAYEIAKELHAPLDLILVRKLGAPQFPELAMGAIASGGVEILNQSVIQSYQIQQDDINKVKMHELQELSRREKAYKGNTPPTPLTGKDIIIVDDGLATGYTMLVAIKAVKSQKPKSITVAVPVAPVETLQRIAKEVDQLICLFQPSNFSAIGQFYKDFDQLQDEDVSRLLQNLAQESSN